MIDARAGVGVVLCLVTALLTVWLYAEDFRMVRLRDPSSWPVLALVAFLIQIAVPGYLLTTKAAESTDQQRTLPGVSGNCSTVVGRDNFGSINPDCRQYNYGPEKQKNGLYQNGERVGAVADAVKDGSHIALTNPRLDTGSLDISKPLLLGSEEIQILCPTLTSMFNPNAGRTTAMIAGTIICDRVK